MEARDKDGTLAINNDSEIRGSLLGEGDLLAAGNASPIHDGSFTDGSFKLFRGKGLIIVRSNGVPGEITIEAQSPGMSSGELVIQAN